MASVLARWFRRTPKPIPAALWQRTLGEFAFLAMLQRADRVQLHRLAAASWRKNNSVGPMAW